MADNDSQIDLKKRARRRLVGSAALALAAAIVLPMVMDHEPRPPSQDVQIRIPSQEGSNFTSRVITGKGPAPSQPVAGVMAEESAPPIVDDGARRAAFYEPARRPTGQRCARLLLPGDAALPRLGESPAFSDDDPAPRHDLPLDDGVSVFGEVGGGRGTVERICPAALDAPMKCHLGH